MKKTFSLLLCLLSFGAFAQFTEISAAFGIVLTGNTAQSGCGASMYDFDHDGWDDMTIGQPFSAILVYHNNNGVYELVKTFDNTGDPKALIWVDYDNDGDSDFFMSILNQSCKLFRNDGGLLFTDVSSNLNLPVLTAKSFGCAWGDYDKDGFLDVYICNYSQGPTLPTNWLLHNNGDGSFTNVTNIMGVGNGQKPSYQCTWIDVNQDGWLDLYVANDFDFMNELYINNGSTFDAAGSSWALDIAMEGMSNAWNDMDSDGDYDLFISNNTDGNELLRNDNNVMTNISASAGVSVNSTCWGSLWMDYDHDGLDDLHISTSNVAVNSNQNYLYHNNGDYTFDDVSMVNDKQIVFSSAKGDQNNDGWWDFLEMKQYPAAIALWRNNGGTNHWMKIGLTGTVSNRDGVGAVIRYYYPGKSGLLHTFCGEGYLEQDSQYEIISMADNAVMDSVVVHWPSGWVDRYYNLASEQLHQFVEGETYQASVSILNNELLCESGNTISLQASEGASFLWSNDSTIAVIEISEAGTYSVIVTNEFGVSDEATIAVQSVPLAEINSTVSDISCYGSNDGCITLTAVTGSISDVSWNGNTGNAQLCDLAAGDYSADIIDNHGCPQTIDFTLDEPSLLQLNAGAATACFNSTVPASIIATGGTGNYTFDYGSGVDPENLFAGNYIFTVHDENNCTAQDEFEVAEFPELLFEILPDSVCAGQTVALQYTVSGGVPQYSIDWQGYNPEQIPGGDFSFVVTDQSGCEKTTEVTITQSGPMVIVPEIQNAAGGNNGSISITVNNGIEPYSYAWNDVQGGSTLENIGQGIYHVVVTDAIGCTVEEDVNVIDTYVEVIFTSMMISPNPCRDYLQIQLSQPAEIHVHDTMGRLIYFNNILSISTTIDTSSWGPGIYILGCGDARRPIVKE